MKKTTHIRIRISTKEKLNERGKMGDSYDDIISKLLGIKK